MTKQASKHSLVFDCHFPEDEVCKDENKRHFFPFQYKFYLLLFFPPFYQMSHGEGEEESDIFAIREVSFQPEGDTEWKETSYTLNTDSLDWVRFFEKTSTDAG